MTTAVLTFRCNRERRLFKGPDRLDPRCPSCGGPLRPVREVTPQMLSEHETAEVDQ